MVSEEIAVFLTILFGLGHKFCQYSIKFQSIGGM